MHFFFSNSELYTIGPPKSWWDDGWDFPRSKRKMVICPGVDTLFEKMFTNFFEEILQRTHPHFAAVLRKINLNRERERNREEEREKGRK